MITIDITTTDAEHIHGYVPSRDEANIDGGVAFFHKEGGQAFIPSDEVMDVHFGEKEVQVEIAASKIEKPSERRKIAPKRKNSGPTKLELCVQILKPIWQEMSRKECIKVLMQEVDMTSAGASTYYSNAKKILKGG